MKKELIEVLELIEKNGFNAYVIGGFVRDFYMGKESFDYDICTNARPHDLKNIFTIISENYGSMKIVYKKTYFEITTYRKELAYKGNRIPIIEYIDSLEEDLLRRDFTINTICMNKNMKYIDLLNGIDDINNKRICMVGNPNIRIKEDPLRILRAIRFATILDFDIAEEISSAIINNKKLVSKLSYFRRKEELDKIFSNDNIEKGIYLLKQYKLEPYLEINLNDVIFINNYLAIWAQINPSSKYPFNKKEKNIINNIKKLLNTKFICSHDIYIYGLDLCLLVGKIKGINEKNIIELERNLVIKNRKEININPSDIESISSISISESYILIEKEILNNNLLNEREKIIEFLRSI